MKNVALKKRIIDLSFKYKLSHIGSCLTAVDIIDEIYQAKKPDEKFVLSSGHAGLALYCVLEEYSNYEIQNDDGSFTEGKYLDAEKIWLHHGVHPDRCEECHLDCSTGSLGQGLPISLGMALADRSKNVYCLVSDGEIAEGSIWESIRIIHDQRIKNLKLYINWNGYGAYDQSSRWAYATLIGDPLINFRVTDMKGWPSWLQDQAAHYVSMDEKMYQEVLAFL